MILEEETYKKFGYHSYDLKPKSDKKIIAVCDDCGKMRILKKHDYHALCVSCAQKGDRSPNWKGGPIMQICEECGIEFPVYPSDIKLGRGKFCSPACFGQWFSENRSGANSSHWKNGASFEPYCVKFNEEFKEYIREKFGRICFLCGKTEKDNGRKLDVHHVNGNKACGCDGDKTCQFVPLCRVCHGKMHSKKIDWEAKIKAKMQSKLNGWYI